jgi:hypothetical protein
MLRIRLYTLYYKKETTHMAIPVSDLLPSRGRVASPLLLEVRAELKPDDLLRLSEAPKTTVPVLQKLRAVHHHQARLMAQGKTHGEIAAIIGCSVQRLVQLNVDPAFMSLVEYYKDQLMEQMLSDSARLQDKIVDVGEMAVDELHERLEDDDKRRKLPIGEVRKIAEFAMDRTVAPMKTAAPPNATPTAVTINFGTSLRSTDDLGIIPLPEPPTRASAPASTTEPAPTIDSSVKEIPDG